MFLNKLIVVTACLFSLALFSCEPDEIVENQTELINTDVAKDPPPSEEDGIEL